MFGKNYSKIIEAVAKTDRNELYSNIKKAVSVRNIYPKWVYEGGSPLPPWGRGDYTVMALMETLLSPRWDWEQKDFQFPYHVFATQAIPGWQGYLGIGFLEDLPVDDVSFYRDAKGQQVPCVFLEFRDRPKADCIYCVIKEADNSGPNSVEFWPGRWYKDWGEDEWDNSIRGVPVTPDWDHPIASTPIEAFSEEEVSHLGYLRVSKTRALDLGVKNVFFL